MLLPLGPLFALQRLELPLQGQRLVPQRRGLAGDGEVVWRSSESGTADTRPIQATTEAPKAETNHCRAEAADLRLGVGSGKICPRKKMKAT